VPGLLRARRQGRFPLSAASGGASLITLVCQTTCQTALALRAGLSEFLMLLSILVLAAGALAAVGVFVANHPVGDNDPFGV
jgi:hypothetical protein